MTDRFQDLCRGFCALEKGITAKLLRTNEAIRVARNKNPTTVPGLKLVRRDVDKLLSKTKVTKCKLLYLTEKEDEIILPFKNLYTEIRESYMRFN